MEIANKHGEIKQKQAVGMGIKHRPHQHNELGIELSAGLGNLRSLEVMLSQGKKYGILRVP